MTHVGSRRFMTYDVEKAADALRSFYGLHETFPEKLLFSRHHLELNADGELLQTHQGWLARAGRASHLAANFKHAAAVAGKNFGLIRTYTYMIYNI